ncbi:hypothetical protein T4A_2213 [Trichinella pseudospiralis]|uniref:Uncharacterized protein n=1 Tax=Trichinella pseudospiralis TaxID=6337 RepID=A0A0V1EZJ7_TRIPS|nr:hypothetical protein T4A_2213 [Trichinella pseudospiralis]KRZ45728.1 hypothetical protein T4C_5811 [Trichinella pseudospiralis]
MELGLQKTSSCSNLRLTIKYDNKNFDFKQAMRKGICNLMRSGSNSKFFYIICGSVVKAFIAFSLLNDEALLLTAAIQ